MSDKKRARKRVTIDYNNGKIYQMVNDVNDMIYIGSTTTTLSKRLSEHRRATKLTKFYTALQEIGPEHFQIILVELFPCTCKAELEAREYAVMNGFAKEKLYNSILNGKHDDASREKMSKHWTGKLGEASNPFSRGCISHNGKRFQYIWSVDGKSTSKSFCYPKKRSAEMAYMACVDLRNQIYPMTNREYLEELPFADE